MAGKRRRENRRKRRRERGRSNGSNASAVPVARGEPPKAADESRLDLPDALRVRGERNPVDIGSSLQASILIPAVPTLPPVETWSDNSNPLQSLESSVRGIIGKLAHFVASIFSHSGDAAGNMLEGLDSVDGGLEDKVRAKLDHILEIRSQAVVKEDLEKSERFRVAYARLGDYLRELQTTDIH